MTSKLPIFCFLIILTLFVYPLPQFAASESATLNRQAAMDRYKTLRETFQKRLEAITDERKKLLVERIDAKMTNINTRRTDRMTEVLKKLDAILKRIQEKEALAKTDGKNTTVLDNAIQKAQAALSTAQTAVSNQVAKEYIIQITTEGALRNTVGAAMKKLESDMRTTHKTVVDAKQAVYNAAKELAKLRGEGGATATDSGTPTATGSGE